MMLQKNIISCEYSFFQSYHGSSIADAHAAHLKCKIHSIHSKGVVLRDIDKVIEVLNENKIKNTFLYKF